MIERDVASDAVADRLATVATADHGSLVEMEMPADRLVWCGVFDTPLVFNEITAFPVNI